MQQDAASLPAVPAAGSMARYANRAADQLVLTHRAWLRQFLKYNLAPFIAFLERISSSTNSRNKYFCYKKFRSKLVRQKHQNVYCTHSKRGYSSTINKLNKQTSEQL